jgi:hypothetical protein
MEISITSKQEAKAFAQKWGLNREAEAELASLLERTWQDGVKCEQTQHFIDTVIKPNVVKSEPKKSSRFDRSY